MFKTLLPVALASAAVGCGELHHKLEYEAATLTGPAAGGYSRMSTGELPASSQIQHPAVADVHIRFEDGAVFHLVKFPEREAKARSAAQSDAGAGLTCFHLAPSNSTLFYRGGKLVGAVLADGIEVGNQEQGPFFELPASAAQVRAVLGKPQREGTFRGRMKWN